MKIFNHLFFKKTAVIILLAASLMSFTAGDDNSFETTKNLDLFYSIYKETELYYVDKIVPGEIIKKGIDAMLESLDPYTVYIPESKTEDLKIMTTGEYGGIGALIRKKGDYTAISQPYEDSPAAKAGLINGDVILEIDGKSIKGKDSEAVSELLRGEAKTKLKLKIKRFENDKDFEVTIEREVIKMKSVPYYSIIDKNTGYIFLSEFTSSAAKEVKDAFTTLQKESNMDCLILDLRGNPGGLLQEAVKICNLFIDKDNLVVSMRGKVKEMDKNFKTTTNPIDNKIKIIVLVNRGSASASEIVAGCFQDLDRGIIVGEKSFGKGLVQSTRPLPYNSILKVTTAKYYTPSGRCIQVLDYSHRNEDGSVGNIPDSLKSKFNTKNGRTVYDGGGIEPDVKTEEPEFSFFSANLITQDIISDFSAMYRNKHTSIESAQKFDLSEKEFKDFVDFVKKSNFKYESKSGLILKELIKEAKDEKFYENSNSELQSLEKKLSPNVETELLKYKPEIIQLIEAEILANYYYNKGVIIYNLRKDITVKEALKYANNNELYNKILKVNEKK